MPKKRIPHIIDDGIEKKLCSNCKQYKSLDEFNDKKDRWDSLSNECIRCLSERNKRRHQHNFKFPDWVQTREEVEAYLKTVKYRKQTKEDMIKKDDDNEQKDR